MVRDLKMRLKSVVEENNMHKYIAGAILVSAFTFGCMGLNQPINPNDPDGQTRIDIIEQTGQGVARFLPPPFNGLAALLLAGVAGAVRRNKKS